MKTVTNIPAQRLYAPQLVALVSTIDGNRRPNVAPFAWVMSASSDPPLVALAVAPSRYSHHNITYREQFVVNLPTMAILDKLWFCGTNTGRDIDKFEATGLTPAPSQSVEPPRVEECVTHLECDLVDSVEAGDHTIFIGEVVTAVAEDAVITDGVLDMSVVKPLLHLGGKRFATTEIKIIEI